MKKYFIYTSITPDGDLSWVVGIGKILGKAEQPEHNFPAGTRVMRATKIIKTVLMSFSKNETFYPGADELFATFPETKYALLKRLIEGKWE